MTTPTEKQYVTVTAVSQFRIRYVIPMDSLQALNPDAPVDPKWALDSITCNEAEEFSQEHMGEVIIDHRVIGQAEMLAQFDQDNAYLAGWTTAQKLAFVENWQIKTGQPR